MVRRSALIFLGLASPALLACGWFSGLAADLLFLVLVMAFPGVLISLAVARKGRLGPLMVPMVVLTLVLEICGVAMLFLRGRVLESAWLGAWPMAAGIEIYGLWLVPLGVVGLAYGWTFDRWELTNEDLRRYEARRVGSSLDDEG